MGRRLVSELEMDEREKSWKSWRMWSESWKGCLF